MIHITCSNKHIVIHAAWFFQCFHLSLARSTLISAMSQYNWPTDASELNRMEMLEII